MRGACVERDCTCIAEPQFSFPTSSSGGIKKSRIHGPQYLLTFPVLSHRSCVDLLFLFYPAWGKLYVGRRTDSSPARKVTLLIYLLISIPPHAPYPTQSFVHHLYCSGFSISHQLYRGTFQQMFNSGGSFPTCTSFFPLQYPVSDIPTQVLLYFFGGRFRQVFPTPTNPP